MAISRKLKIVKTAILYLAFFALGLIIAVPGPTLLDLQCKVQTDAKHIVYIYIARSAGYVVGSILGGFLYDKYNRQCLLTLDLLFTSVAVFFLPWSSTLLPLLINIAILGIFTGSIDTGGNVYLLSMWGKESNPFLQALHFTFGIGAFVAPLLAEPFLSPISINSKHNNTANFLCDKPEIPPNDSSFLDFFNGLYIEYTYAIIGIYTFIIMIISLATFLYNKESEKSIMEEESEEEMTQTTKQKVFTFLFFLFSVVFIFYYCGLEVVFGQLLASFAVTGALKFTKSNASYLTSCFWGCYTFSRGISILIATKVTALKMIAFNLSLVVFGSILLVLWGNYDAIFLWIGTGLIGFGVAPNFASTLTFFENFVRVKSKIASGFVVGASLGEKLLPLFVTQFVDTQPSILLYVTLGISLICSALFMIMNLISIKLKRYQPKQEIEYFKDSPETLELTNLHK